MYPMVCSGKSAARSFNLGDVFSVAETRNTVSYTTPLHPRVFLGIHPAYTIYSGGKIDLLVDNLLKIKEYI